VQKVQGHVGLADAQAWKENVSGFYIQRSAVGIK
jgi:hypothetical protein